MKTPSQTQIDNCERWGWIYAGDGVFFSVKDDNIAGWFDEDGWNVDTWDYLVWEYFPKNEGLNGDT